MERVASGRVGLVEEAVGLCFGHLFNAGEELGFGNSRRPFQAGEEAVAVLVEFLDANGFKAD